jgi:hypothetical protein
MSLEVKQKLSMPISGSVLAIRKPSRDELHRLIDRIASKQKPWKGKLMPRNG